MKSIIKILILPIVFLTACVDSLDDYNIDQKRAPIVPAEPLYSAAVKSLADILTTPSVNNNNYRLYVQHWSTTQYLDEPRYVLNVRLIPQNFWDAMYRDVLSDLKEARRILHEDQLMNAGVKNNQLGQIGIMEAYSWMILVSTFGNVPYEDALDTSIPLPKYDDAQTIYLDALKKLDESIALLNPTFAGFGTGEFLYSSKAAGQRIAHWLKFANSIKLKMAMVLIDNSATAAVATKAIQEAALNVFTSNADNARFPYLPDPPSNNPVSANMNLSLQSRRDFVGSKPLIDLMNSLHDPRRLHFFDPVPVKNSFVGGFYGYTNNPVANYSEINEKIKAPGFEALFIDYSEVKFLLAEAVARGIIATGTVEEHYHDAIVASHEYWGITEGNPAAQPAVLAGVETGGQNYVVGDVLEVVGGTSTEPTRVRVAAVHEETKAITRLTIVEAGAYSEVPTNPVSFTGGSGTGATLNVTYDGGWSTYLQHPDVAYSTAQGDWKQKIGTQKWVALYNRGWDAWVEWRRLDHPVLLSPSEATPPTGQDSPSTDLFIPVRMIYPISEQTLNPTNRSAASNAIGNDVATTKLFWDVN